MLARPIPRSALDMVGTSMLGAKDRRAPSTSFLSRSPLYRRRRIPDDQEADRARPATGHGRQQATDSRGLRLKWSQQACLATAARRTRSRPDRRTGGRLAGSGREGALCHPPLRCHSGRRGHAEPLACQRRPGRFRAPRRRGLRSLTRAILRAYQSSGHLRAWTESQRVRRQASLPFHELLLPKHQSSASASALSRGLPRSIGQPPVTTGSCGLDR